MKPYELAYLISPDLSDDEAVNLSQKLTASVQENGGKLIEEKKPVKRPLSYLIEKKAMAYLTSFDFSVEAEKISAIRKIIESEPQILRYLIFHKKPMRVRPIRAARIKPAAPEPAIKPEIKIEKKPEVKLKVELKEIDKKLEEILQK